MTGKRRATLDQRGTALRARLARAAEREAWLARLERGTATCEDLLRAVREKRFPTREAAKRAWGLL